MFDVYPGGNGHAVLQRKIYECVAINMGLATRWIPLNGGSDTRRDARDCHMELAIAARIPFRCIGNATVIIGGRRPPDRGNRYIRHSSRNPIVIEWLHWRKAKRLIRKDLARAA